MTSRQWRVTSDRDDAGDDVALLQQALVLLGFLPGEQSVDSQFGPETEAAVEAAQRHSDSPTTGRPVRRRGRRSAPSSASGDHAAHPLTLLAARHMRDIS